jgi:large subunit ribosomal protein L25
METVEVHSRSATGSRACRKLRDSGHVPAILYGLGQPPVDLQLPAAVAEGLVRRSVKLVNLSGAASEAVRVQAVQWDSLGSNVVHLDFARLSAEQSAAGAL